VRRRALPFFSELFFRKKGRNVRFSSLQPIPKFFFSQGSFSGPFP